MDMCMAVLAMEGTGSHTVLVRTAPFFPRIQPIDSHGGVRMLRAINSDAIEPRICNIWYVLSPSCFTESLLLCREVNSLSMQLIYEQKYQNIVKESIPRVLFNSARPWHIRSRVWRQRGI